MANRPSAVSMRGISKSFPGVQALKDVDFDLKPGEIHALLGENGAGKTTLMNVLYGLYSADGGSVRLRGEIVDIHEPQEAIELGIGMVHQLFKQVYRHTVAENIALAARPGFLFPDHTVKARLRELMEKYGWTVDPDTEIWRLSAADRQKVEILKVLYRGAKILIMDEPTSVLTPQGKEELFENLTSMRDSGYAIVFITHKLDEVKQISDRVTILRDGEKIDTTRTDEATKSELARKMVGREVIFDFDREPVQPGETVLELQDLHVLGDRGEVAVEDVSFSIRRGEIFGLAGVGGSGQTELLEAITRLRDVQRGRVVLLGEDLTGATTRRTIDAGISYVPEQRDRLAMVPSMSVKENLILKGYRRPPFRSGWFMDWDAVDRHARRQIENYNIVTTGPDARVSLLSGGNLQKVLLAREIEQDPELLIATYPTQGLDIGTIEHVHNLLLDQRDRLGILLVSEDLDEIQRLSDRIGVLFEGRLMGVVENEKVTKEQIGMMMVGTPHRDLS